MREIKFRAWDKKEKIMRYGVDIKNSAIGARACFATPNSFMMFYSEPKDEVLMQFTGLCDKNNKPIYEGDIVRFWTWSTKNIKDGLIDHVCFADDGFWSPFNDGQYIQDEQGDPFDNDRGFEIIGNLYENPELITNQL